jgi:serine protease Do
MNPLFDVRSKEFPCALIVTRLHGHKRSQHQPKVIIMRNQSFIRTTAALVFACAASLTPLASSAGPRDTPTSALATRVLPSTVTVRGGTLIGTSFITGLTGSGIIVDSSGIVLTNEHVIRGQRDIKINFYGNDVSVKGTLIWVDVANDLAAVKFDTAGKTYAELELGSSYDLKVGEPAIAIGTPLGEEFTVTQGIISKLHATPDSDEINWGRRYLIQTDASINLGNSGGSLFNAEGDLVGIVELKKGPTGLGWAITADRAARLLSIGLSASSRAGINHGIKSIEMKVNATSGEDHQTVIVKELEENGPAQNVLHPGDRIIKVEERPIHNGFDLERVFWSKKPGDKVKLAVSRGDQRLELSLTLADATKTEIKD